MDVCSWMYMHVRACWYQFVRQIDRHSYPPWQLSCHSGLVAPSQHFAAAVTHQHNKIKKSWMLRATQFRPRGLRIQLFPLLLVARDFLPCLCAGPLPDKFPLTYDLWPDCWQREKRRKSHSCFSHSKLSVLILTNRQLDCFVEFCKGQCDWIFAPFPAPYLHYLPASCAR